jgi:hypothetical protein
MKKLPSDALPKGMEVPVPDCIEPPITLREMNYVAEICEALATLPFEVHVKRCELKEEGGTPPEMMLYLCIHRKEGVG